MVLDLLVMVLEDCVFYWVFDVYDCIVIGYDDLLVVLCMFSDWL